MAALMSPKLYDYIGREGFQRTFMDQTNSTNITFILMN